jgi:hypothetical protein
MSLTKLTPETVEQALNCAAISHATKAGCMDDISLLEIWFCDLDLIVKVRRGRGCQDWECCIGASIERTKNNSLILMIHPYDNIDNWLTDIQEKELPDEKVIKYLRKYVKRLIEVIAEKGVYWSLRDEDWRIGGRKKYIAFKPTVPRGKGSPYLEDWRILYDPTENKDRI